MASRRFNFKNLLILLASVMLLQIELGYCVDFSRTTTGVAFSAYVHNNVSTDDHKSYTKDDVKTMIKVVSSRFSKIVTFGVAADIRSGAEYDPEASYEQHSYSQVFAAEAAALVNKEMNATSPGSQITPIEMFVGIELHSYDKKLNMETGLAFESAQKANLIFNNTVKGVVITGTRIGVDLHNTTLAANLLNEQSEHAKRANLKMGSVQSCEGLRREESEETLRDSRDPAVKNKQLEIVELSDFIICRVDLSEANRTLDAKSAFAKVGNKFLQYKNDLKEYGIEVMGLTGGWPANMSNPVDVDQMKTFWETADKWAAANKFNLWIFEAFDNPWKTGDTAHFGWWKLTQDSLTNKKEGYIEKLSLLKPKGPNTTPTTTTTPKSSNGTKTITAKAGSGKKNAAGREMVNGYSFWILMVIALNSMFH